MNFRHLKAQMGIMGRVLLLALRRLDDGFATAARTGDRLENAAAEEANKADAIASASRTCARPARAAGRG